ERVDVEPAGIVVRDAVERGNHVRSRGEDVRAGQPLLRPGQVLRPCEIGLLAAQGFSDVSVVRLPRTAVLATGDELSSGALGPGRIRNSNGPALAAAVERWGLPVADRGVAGDAVPAVRRAVEEAAGGADVLLVTGGVSVGDLDCTRAALGEAGFEERFWKVAIKPGKPLFFATRGETLAFGLPGNPVAALLCLEEFVRPALEGLQGLSLRYPAYHLRGRALNDYPADPGRRRYLFCRAREEGGGFALEIIRPQGSARLGMACRADALAVAEGGRVRKGDELSFRWFK
ncbi:MAG: molybdopterin molybdotransferase MoeA, partial [Elusimicrobia bacterium]|nr:molybdopterin molybdotransferase MoeA [Elusimicrobiota bacterium]